MFGTKTVLLLSVIAFLYGRPDFLDLALAYALINFIGVLAVLEFIRRRASGDTGVGG
jgi:multicomponent Na+:H+ antiporter subunit F